MCRCGRAPGPVHVGAVAKKRRNRRSVVVLGPFGVGQGLGRLRPMHIVVVVVRLKLRLPRERHYRPLHEWPVPGLVHNRVLTRARARVR